jgi:hypothetical protein
MAKTPEQKAAEAAAKAEAKAKLDAEKAEAKAAADAAAQAAPAPAGQMTKAAYQKIIDAYKVSNPVKYELKKDEFARKLATLK